jgi:tetratricopeptide (TPR) repeat protein
MLPINPARVKAIYSQAMAAQKAGRLDAALALYAQVLSLRPDLAEAQFQVGQIHAARGNRAKAEAALRKALKSRPGEPAIWAALAKTMHGRALNKLRAEAARVGVTLEGEPDITALLARVRGGQAAAAEAEALALVRKFPDAARPALALGAARAAQNKWGLALPPLEKAVERDPSSPMAQMLLGEVLLNMGQVFRSEEALLMAQKLGADVSIPLARLLRETCRDVAAENTLARAGASDKRKPRLLSDHAMALATLRRPKEAARIVEKAIAAGAPAITRGRLASAMSSEGDVDAALTVVKAALDRDPGNTDLLTLHGQLLQSGGDFDAARAVLMQAISASRDAAEAIRSYVGGGKLTEDDPILPVLQARAGDLSLPVASRRTLGFAMAKALEDLGRYDEVFGHLHRANRLMKSEFPYRFENERGHVQAVLEAYRVLKGRDLAGPAPQDAPIFVTGMARSGTTLVETILSAHSTVTAGGELPFLTKALARVIDLANLAPDRFGNAMATAGHDYISAARRRTGTETIFTDKAISTYARIGLAAMALPNARFIVLKRDPRDVGLSIYRNMFTPGAHLYASDLGDIGRFIRQHDAFVEFWGNEMPGKVHVVEYEALTADPEPVIRDLVSAAGLEWQDACLSPHKATRSVATLSFAQVRQPIYRGSVAAWKRYENELAPLFDALEKSVTL